MAAGHVDAEVQQPIGGALQNAVLHGPQHRIQCLTGNIGGVFEVAEVHADVRGRGTGSDIQRQKDLHSGSGLIAGGKATLSSPFQTSLIVVHADRAADTAHHVGDLV